jgi:hypothetical protein
MLATRMSILILVLFLFYLTLGVTNRPKRSEPCGDRWFPQEGFFCTTQVIPIKLCEGEEVSYLKYLPGSY